MLPGGKDTFKADAVGYDSMGNVVPLFAESGGLAAGVDKKLIVLRLQASHIHDSHTSKDLGSVLFADTYFQLDLIQGNDTALNLTKNVPAIQIWQTTNKHYEHLPLPIMTEKNIQSERLGARVNYYQDLTGLLPLKQSYIEIFRGQQTDLPLLNVKLVFYEKGMIL